MINFGVWSPSCWKSLPGEVNCCGWSKILLILSMWWKRRRLSLLPRKPRNLKWDNSWVWALMVHAIRFSLSAWTQCHKVSESLVLSLWDIDFLDLFRWFSSTCQEVFSNCLVELKGNELVCFFWWMHCEFDSVAKSSGGIWVVRARHVEVQNAACNAKRIAMSTTVSGKQTIWSMLKPQFHVTWLKGFFL